MFLLPAPACPPILSPEPIAFATPSFLTPLAKIRLPQVMMTPDPGMILRSNFLKPSQNEVSKVLT